MSDAATLGRIVIEQPRAGQRLSAGLITTICLTVGAPVAVSAVWVGDDPVAFRVVAAAIAALALWGVVIGLRSFRDRFEIDRTHLWIHSARGPSRMPLHEVVQFAPDRINPSRRVLTPWCLAVELTGDRKVRLDTAPASRPKIEAAARQANERLTEMRRPHRL